MQDTREHTNIEGTPPIAILTAEEPEELISEQAKVSRTPSLESVCR